MAKELGWIASRLSPADGTPGLAARQLRWMRRQFFDPETPLFGIGILAALVIVVLALVVVWTAFLAGLPTIGAEYSFVNYMDVATSPLFPKAAWNTAVVALGTVTISLFFALPIAWLTQRTNMPARNLVIILMFVPILLPGFLRVMGYIMLASPDIGLVNQWLRTFIPVKRGPLNVYGIIPIAIVQGLSLTTTAFLMTAGAFRSIDPTLEESAEVSGAPRFQTFRRITLPVIMPAVVAAAIYNFMTAVSMFETAALLGMSRNIWVFSTLMYASVHDTEGFPRYGIAAVYGVILMLPTLLALFYYQRMIKRSHRYATVTGRGYRPKILDLGKWKVAGLGFVLFYFFIEFVLPLTAVLWTSINPYIRMPSTEAFATLTLDGYRGALSLLSSRNVLLNTVQLVLGVGVAAPAISLIFAWIVLRTRMPGRYALDTISMLPHAIPGVTFAFSVLVFGLLIARVVPVFYGSLLAIIVADTILRLPFGTRTLSTSLIQIHPELEQAVEVCGGSRITAIRKVTMPLVLPALFYTFVWSMLHAYREVTIALFLQTPRNFVMSTAIWDRWSTGDSGTAAAMGILMVGFMGLLILVLLRAFPRIFGTRMEI